MGGPSGILHSREIAVLSDGSQPPSGCRGSRPARLDRMILPAVHPFLLHITGTARPMGDFDLMVRKKDLRDVAATMRALGFREMDRRPGFAATYSNTLKFIK